MAIEFKIYSKKYGWSDWTHMKTLLYQSTHWEEIEQYYDIWQKLDGEWVLVSKATKED